MKINHSLLECTRDNDTQVSELEPSGPSCYYLTMKHVWSAIIVFVMVLLDAKLVTQGWHWRGL